MGLHQKSSDHAGRLERGVNTEQRVDHLARHPVGHSGCAGVQISWDETNQKDWDGLIGQAPFHAYQQSYPWGDALKEVGVRVYRAKIMLDGCPIGVAQIQLKKILGFLTVALVLRGPVWCAGDVSAEIYRSAIDKISWSLPVHGLHGLIVTPESNDGEALKQAGFKRIMGGHHTVMIDLDADDEALRTQLNGKWRNRLKAAEKSAIIVSPLGRRPEKYAWLLEKEEHQQRAAKYHALPSIMVHNYQARTAHEGVICFSAKSEATRVGGMLFLVHGDCASYHIGWASDEGKSDNVHNLLLWRSMLALRRTGIKRLDLGGVNTDLNPGIARFKIGTGGEVLSYPGTWSRGLRWKRQG